MKSTLSREADLAALSAPAAPPLPHIDILESSVPDAERDILELAQRNTQRVLTMLDPLLEAALVESTGQVFTRQPVDLAQLLSEAAADAHPAADPAGIGLVLEPIPHLPTLRVDAVALRRVLDNLLGNALSYTPAGGQITVAAAPCTAPERDAAAPGAVAVSVTDTGPGVPLEHRERIFERFVRLPGTGGKRRGFGLGRYNCRQVVEAHGGRIWVEPRPCDVGSRFTFILPAGEMAHA